MARRPSDRRPSTARDYTVRFDGFVSRTLYERLCERERQAIRELAFLHRFTFQELRGVVEAARDLEMWGEPGIAEWNAKAAPTDKRAFLHRLDARMAQLREEPSRYPRGEGERPRTRERKPVVTRRTDKKIHGMCPVASELTVCCNLRTIDAVERCVFGCSYCAVQTFYSDDIALDADFAAKLAAIEIDPDRFYHFGTGQASDSLAYGNRDGILDALLCFARRHPNVLLEFKTKSANVGHFLEADVPANVVCSWSLNTPTIIASEEHFTARLEGRLGAARAVADRGVRVAFHFHPMVHYDRWRNEYPALAREAMTCFTVREVAFVSFGSVTMIKPAIRKLRETGNHTRIHQADFVPDPHGKLTYRDGVKVDMFSTMYEAFEPWHEDVFFYLCMEKASIWEQTFGRVYESNEAFERDFGARTLPARPAAGNPARPL